MDVVKLRKELDKLYVDISAANFGRDHITREAMFRLINYNRILLTELVGDKLAPEEQTVTIKKPEYENNFVTGVHEIINNGATLNTDILNWYRNLYYKEGNDTERGIMANAINNLFMEMKAKGIELSGLYVSRID